MKKKTSERTRETVWLGGLKNKRERELESRRTPVSTNKTFFWCLKICEHVQSTESS